MPNKIFDNSNIIDECYREHCKINRIQRDIKLPNRGGNIVDVWQIDTEIELFNSVEDIRYYVFFSNTFPHSLPTLYFFSCSYNIGYIPHRESNDSICLFEKQISYDIDCPVDIIKKCIAKANKTIKDGVEGRNKSHFLDEITSYWSTTYDNEPEPIDFDVLHSLTKIPISNTLINTIEILDPIYKGYKYILFDKEECLFVDHIKNKYKHNLSQALFISDYSIKTEPPYHITYNKFINQLSKQSKEDFKKYINNNKKTKKIIVFPLNNQGLIGGIICDITIPKKGFRTGSLSLYRVISDIYSDKYIKRFISQEYSNDRIEERSSGIKNKKWKFIIVGLGSVGSHLTYFLNNINYPEFTFIDDDVLTIENIGRHLLGYSSVNTPKAIAMSSYIENIRPDQVISYNCVTIENHLMLNMDVVNINDYMFIAIGSKIMEDFVISMIKETKLTVPVFVLWVEPYVASGQCVFIKPEDAHKYSQLYDENNLLYKHHIISNKEYMKEIDSKLSRKEAGCESSYSPYSGNDVVLFLSSLYPHINNVITGKINYSFRFSWTGDLSKINDLGLELSENPPITHKEELVIL